MIKKSRETRKKRIKVKIRGIGKVPRVSVYRSNKYLYVQIIDDEKAVTLAAAKGMRVKEVAEDLAKKATKKKIKKVVFDRSGYQYHGKVKALAEELRAQGLVF